MQRLAYDCSLNTNIVFLPFRQSAGNGCSSRPTSRWRCQWQTAWERRQRRSSQHSDLPTKTPRGSWQQPTRDRKRPKCSWSPCRESWRRPGKDWPLSPRPKIKPKPTFCVRNQRGPVGTPKTLTAKKDLIEAGGGGCAGWEEKGWAVRIRMKWWEVLMKTHKQTVKAWLSVTWEMWKTRIRREPTFGSMRHERRCPRRGRGETNPSSQRLLWNTKIINVFCNYRDVSVQCNRFFKTKALCLSQFSSLACTDG